MPKGGTEASRVFFCYAFLDQPKITKVTGSYPDKTCSNVKVNFYSRQLRDENKEKGEAIASNACVANLCICWVCYLS